MNSGIQFTNTNAITTIQIPSENKIVITFELLASCEQYDCISRHARKGSGKRGGAGGEEISESDDQKMSGVCGELKTKN
jgi:hypothetical protein